jgi:cobyrinic acid a,c-diamide synthase
LKAVVIAGATSGVGKTTIATGLMGALVRHGLRVQPFKAGPDYIDPTYHTKVTGTPCRNLDTWMLGGGTIVELFHRAIRGQDIAVVEGVMGLYDGRSATGDEGSTAELAKLLNAPVLLVLDSRKGARSLAAMAGGYRDFDPALRLEGVILNGIGSDRHCELCREAIEHYTGLPVVGYLPRREDLTLPERHLGLVPTVEGKVSREILNRIIAQCQATFDLPAILKIAEGFKAPVPTNSVFPLSPVKPSVGIAVARDEAFSFYYQDSLDLLEARGAELVPFSPLQDTALPPGVSGIYIGGGFPELYAPELAANAAMREAVRNAARDGMPVYAECGGLMYLGESTGDFEQKSYDMAGVLPVASRIHSPKLSLGYRTVKALRDNPLLPTGETVRGHEFHWSVLASGEEKANAYAIVDGGDRREGFQQGNVLASYVHLHFAGRPDMASRFIRTCRQYQEKARGQG